MIKTVSATGTVKIYKTFLDLIDNAKEQQLISKDFNRVNSNESLYHK